MKKAARLFPEAERATFPKVILLFRLKRCKRENIKNRTGQIRSGLCDGSAVLVVWELKKKRGLGAPKERERSLKDTEGSLCCMKLFLKVR